MTGAGRLLLVVVAVIVSSAGLAGPLPPVHIERNLPAKALAKPVVVYNRPYTGAIFADYVPSAAEARAPFTVSMARNEYEPVQVGLYVPADKVALKNVTLEVKCGIPCKVGHIYYTPADQLSWTADTDEATLNKNFPNMTWPCDTKLLVGKRSAIPMYVLPVRSIAEMHPGRSAAFWLTFKTDYTQPPGEHKGTLIIRANGKQIESLPFTVTIYPFTLPRPKIHYGMYYRPYQTPAAYQGRTFQKLYLADMAAHGMNFMDLDVPTTLLSQDAYDLSSSSLISPPEHNAWGSQTTRQYLDNYLAAEDYQPDGGFNVVKLIDGEVRLGREAGLIQRDHPCVTVQSGFNIERKAAALSKLRKYAQEMGWPDSLLYMRDEPGPDVFAEVEKHVGEWRRLGAVGIAAMNPLAAFGVGHVHSIWTVLAGEITPELLREAQRQGADVWTYDFNLRTTNFEAGRYYAGLYTWSLKLKGNMPYAYMGEPNSTVHFDADWKLSGPNVLGYVIPSSNGPVPGVGWEGRREGVDDMRYLQLLEARIKAAGSDNATAKQARQWLEALRVRSVSKEFHPVRYNAWGADFLDPNPRISPEDYGSIRSTAAAFIRKLPQAPGEQNPEPASYLRLQAKPMESEAYEKASASECVAALKGGIVKQQRQAAAALAEKEKTDLLQARDVLISMLDLPTVRMPALRALAKLGPDAAPAMPALGKLQQNEDTFLRLAATHVLTTIRK